MDELEKLKLVIEAELAPYREEMNAIKEETSAMAKFVEKQTNNVKKAFSGVGNFIKRALIGAGLVKFGKEALGIASDVRETESVVELAFGNMRKYVDDFAANSIKTHGMSALSAKQTAGDYMLMSKGMGMADESAAKMSVNVAKLSADMASLKNTSQDMAKTALNGIWTGEAEALKKYGVVMTQANLQEYAYSQGIKQKIQDLSQQEQVMLRYSFVMNSMSMAQGNFQRESQGWAAQTKILGEQWKEFLAIVGDGLTKVLLPVLQFVNKVMGYLIAFAKVVGQVFSSLFGGSKGTAEKVSSSIEPIGGMADNANQSLNDLGSSGADNVGKLGKAAEKAGKQAKGALASFDSLNVLSQATAEPGGGGGSSSGIGRGVGGGVNIPIPEIPEIKPPELDTGWVEKYANKVKNGLEKVIDFVKTHRVDITTLMSGIVGSIGAYKLLKNWENIAKSFKLIKASIAAIGSGISVPLLGAALLIGAVVAAIVELWQKSEGFRNSVIDSWNKIKDLFSTVFNGIKEEISAFWEEYGKPITEGLSTAWQNFVEIIDQMWQQILKPIVDTITESLKVLWENILQPMFRIALTLIGEAINIILKLWNDILSPLIQWLIEKLSPIVKDVTEGFVKAWEFVSSAINPIFEGINKLIKGISKFLQDLIDFVKNVFTGNWDEAWQSLELAFKNLWEGIKGFVKGIWDGILNIFVGVGTWFYTNVLSPIFGVFSDVFNSIGDFISDKWNWILGLFTKGGQFFSGIAESIGSVFVRIVNGLIDGINWVIAKPFDFINGILNDISGVSIFGARPFGWIGYNPIPVPQIPYLDVGTNYVAREGVAYIHEGEAVVPKKYNPALGNTDEEEKELLREQNALLRQILEKDNSVYLDGDELHQSNEKRKRDEFDRYGYAY